VRLDSNSPLVEDNHQITSILVAIMPAITIKNLPDGLYERLKANSKAHHRSINGELIATLERALTAQRADPLEQLARIRSLRESLDLPTLDPNEIRAAIESGRP
jgi:plasmid stability protein